MKPTLTVQSFSPCASNRWVVCACLLVLFQLSGLAHAQQKVFRCGNEYLNSEQEAKKRGCKVVEGGNVTIVQGTSVRGNSSGGGAPRASSAGNRSGSGTERVDSAEQRARDSDARSILQAELNKANERLNDAKKAYANGEPEKEGIEGRNNQRYLDRVAELKAAVGRAESDVAGLQRELSRLPGGAATAENATN